MEAEVAVTKTLGSQSFETGAGRNICTIIHGVKTLMAMLLKWYILNCDIRSLTRTQSIPVAPQSKAWVSSHSLAGIQIPPGAWMSVSSECRVLSGRSLCDGPITRPEESYRVWCV
jgi:hypothetical protein